jgi:DNA-binding response OmpR family regulator
LLSDVMMPKVMGPEVVRRAQRMRHGDLRILFMTGGFDGVLLRHTDRILEKPWSCEELVAAIRGALSDMPERVAWDGPERRAA